ncbi:hypothetical protein C8R34_1238 [Nitrosomonas sp. Nm84]|nr:hypothetical protein C8R34_1238 [Nitrosomonas sp. Nm84]
MMAVDWNAVATIAAPVITLFLGVWVNRKFESRPALISYFSHVSAFRYSPPGGQPVGINTHSVVLRNIGRKSAIGIRIHHNTLPDFNIWPAVMHSVETLPDGTKDIVIPTLVPGEQITVSYLYLYPVTVDQVNAGIKSDHGFSQQISVLLQRQFPRWVNFIVGTLMITGFVAILYVLYTVAIQ